MLQIDSSSYVAICGHCAVQDITLYGDEIPSTRDY